jgi:hypothetical protein
MVRRVRPGTSCKSRAARKTRHGRLRYEGGFEFSIEVRSAPGNGWEKWERGRRPWKLWQGHYYPGRLVKPYILLCNFVRIWAKACRSRGSRRKALTCEAAGPVQMRRRQPLDQLSIINTQPRFMHPSGTPRTVRSVPSACGGFLARRRGTLLANVSCSVLACARPLLVFLQGALREEGTGSGIFVKRRQDSRRSLLKAAWRRPVREQDDQHHGRETSDGHHHVTPSTLTTLRRNIGILFLSPWGLTEEQEREVQEDGQGHAQDHADGYPEQAPWANAHLGCYPYRARLFNSRWDRIARK